MLSPKLGGTPTQPRENQLPALALQGQVMNAARILAAFAIMETMDAANAHAGGAIRATPARRRH